MSANPDMPALIVQPDAASRTALQTTLSTVFGGYEVKLSDDALTRSSLLVLETGASKTIANPPLTGRVLSRPYQFRLIKNGDDCILVDLRDDTRHALANTTCMPE